MVVEALNFFHKIGFRRPLNWISQAAYFLKGYGYVRARYHPSFRAYEYKVAGIVYLSLGPGWAYTYDYLRSALHQTYNFRYTPAEGDCIVDIGAGLGEETVVYAQLVGARGKVHAVEANPATYRGLQYLCAQNNFSWVVPHHLAIFSQEGEVTIEDDKENYLTNTINLNSSANGAAKVKAKTLDGLVAENNITKIDFLKSNIEGAEQFLIQGMSASVKIVRNVCISCHDFRHRYHDHGVFYVTKSKVRSYLEENNFKVSIRNTGNRVVDDYIYASNLQLS